MGWGTRCLATSRALGSPKPSLQLLIKFNGDNSGRVRSWGVDCRDKGASASSEGTGGLGWVTGCTTVGISGVQGATFLGSLACRVQHGRGLWRAGCSASPCSDSRMIRIKNKNNIVNNQIQHMPVHPMATVVAGHGSGGEEDHQDYCLCTSTCRACTWCWCVKGQECCCKKVGPQIDSCMHASCTEDRLR